jgi:hypothetical protein
VLASPRVKAVVGFAAASAVVVASSTASAYRPFDGTDADVADVGEFELELGPAHYYATHGTHYVIAPATVLNLGLVKNVELVVDFKNFVGIDAVPGQSRVRVLDTDVFLKWVFRRGVLQDEKGLSMAVEAGPLTPEIQGLDHFGAQALFIFSHRWSGGTVHFNEQGAYTRSGNVDLFSSVILEGPHDQTIRPVMELFFEHEFGENVETYSALVGAIWAAAEGFDLDLALRAANEHGTSAGEVRLGFTWAVSLWDSPSKRVAGGPMRRAWAMR